MAINNLKPIMLAGENLPDIILLDINMPIMDGWQFLDEFVKIESHKLITIYIVSSSIDPQDIKRAKKYQNISNYIVKPITIKKLKTIMRDYALS
nr:response regulator [uncultured Psychroserpens sp.]